MAKIQELDIIPPLKKPLPVVDYGDSEPCVDKPPFNDVHAVWGLQDFTGKYGFVIAEDDLTY